MLIIEESGWQSLHKSLFLRVVQIFVEPVIRISFEVVHELEQSERGEGGFGSTGIK